VKRNCCKDGRAVSNRIELGDFLYDSDEQTLRLPHGLGETQINFGFCSGTNWRYGFPGNAETEKSDDGVRITTKEFFIPPRLGHGGIVCYHRPEYPAGLTVGNVQGTAELKRTEHGFDAVLSGRAPDKIKSAFVHMKHFPMHAEILVPAMGGYSIKDLPPGIVHQFEYPNGFGWIYQFVIFQVDNAGMMIRFDDPAYSIKRLVLSTLEPEHGLQLSIYAVPTDADTHEQWTSPPFKFESFHGGWEVAAKRYRDWLETERGLKPFRTAEIVPERQRDISLVINLRAHNWPPFLYSTFDQMCDRLKEVAQYINPRHCVAYIEGFDGGYTSAGTEFWPGAEAGGPESFRKLINWAHELGYLLIPYLHTHCLVLSHPKFERFKNDAFATWVTDTDGDGVCELNLLNMRTDNTEWNEMVLPNIERMFKSFDIDGVLLDQIAIFVPKTHPAEYIRSCQEFIRRVKAMMRPGSFLLTESLGEPYLDSVRMGMTPVHSESFPAANKIVKPMPGLNHMRFHPVLKYVSNYFGRLVGHCSVRAAEEIEAHEYQARNYSMLGVIPLLSLHRPTEKIADSPLLLADIARARRIAEGNESLEYDKT